MSHVDRMNLAHVRQFVAVAEHMHFGRAAEALGIPQPQLTRAVQALERALRVRLFSRTTRQIALTPAGEVFLQEGAKLLAQAELARYLAQEAEAGGTARLRIAFVAPALDILPKGLKLFRQAWPHVEIALERMSSEGQLVGLRNGSIDIGLLCPSGRNVEGLDVNPIARSRYSALVPSEWPIAKRSYVKLIELSDLPFLQPPPEVDPQVYKAIHLACQRAGFEPRTVSVAAQAYAMEALVAAEEGLTLQPEMWRAIRLPGVTHVPVVDLPDYLYWELAAVSVPQPYGSPALQGLVRTLREAAEGRTEKRE
jgi:DNA-binding transcriptional LysR family regulator